LYHGNCPVRQKKENVLILSGVDMPIFIIILIQKKKYLDPDPKCFRIRIQQKLFKFFLIQIPKMAKVQGSCNYRYFILGYASQMFSEDDLPADAILVGSDSEPIILDRLQVFYHKFIN
jgi:hypothetical protein